MSSFIHFLRYYFLCPDIVINRRWFWYPISIRQRSHKSSTLVITRHQSINNNTIKVYTKSIEN